MHKNLSKYIFNANNDPDYFFSCLTQEQKEVVETSSVVQEIKKGRHIFKEGKEPAGLIYLNKGSAKLFKYGSGDREQIVRLVKPLSFVGYKALFTEKPHTTSAEAIENSEIVIYNKESIFYLIDNNAQFARKVIKTLADELAFNYNRLINLTQKHIRGRLAETLLLIKDIYGVDKDGKTLVAKFTRENIAHFSNMTTANAIRTLKIFKEEGLIDTEGKRITLMNIDALFEISKLG